MPYGLHGTQEWAPACFECIGTVSTEVKHVWETVWYIFTFQDGCELPENGLLGLCLGTLLPQVPAVVEAHLITHNHAAACSFLPFFPPAAPGGMGWRIKRM